jgi:hypothetical protein
MFALIVVVFLIADDALANDAREAAPPWRQVFIANETRAASDPLDRHTRPSPSFWLSCVDPPFVSGPRRPSR